MMQTDVKSAHASGTVSTAMYAASTRLKGLLVSGVVSTAATVKFFDGTSASGTVMLEFDIVSNTNPIPLSVPIPGEGILFRTGIFVTTSAAITTLTIFHG
jgi:hypothetical protein